MRKPDKTEAARSANTRSENAKADAAKTKRQGGQVKRQETKNVARKEAVAQLRQILVRRRDALRKALAGDLSSLKELRQQTSGDMMDAAMDTAQDEISSQLAEVESRELAHIDVALEAMRQGNYGTCDGCGSGIPLARLQALPYATMCIGCQREAEKNGDVIGAGSNRMFDFGLSDSSDVGSGDVEIDIS
jgi:DnaK suppressor protein